MKNKESMKLSEVRQSGVRLMLVTLSCIAFSGLLVGCSGSLVSGRSELSQGVDDGNGGGGSNINRPPLGKAAVSTYYTYAHAVANALEVSLNPVPNTCVVQNTNLINASLTSLPDEADFNKVSSAGVFFQMRIAKCLAEAAAANPATRETVFPGVDFSLPPQQAFASETARRSLVEDLTDLLWNVDATEEDLTELTAALGQLAQLAPATVQGTQYALAALVGIIGGSNAGLK